MLLVLEWLNMVTGDAGTVFTSGLLTPTVFYQEFAPFLHFLTLKYTPILYIKQRLLMYHFDIIDSNPPSLDLKRRNPLLLHPSRAFVDCRNVRL